MRLTIPSVALLLVGLGGGCRSEPADPRELLLAQSQGVNYLQKAQLPEAEREFQKVVNLAPRDPIGYANLGLTLLREGRYADAEKQLRRARKLNDASPEAALILARLYSLTNRAGDARKLLEELRPEPRVSYALAELERPRADSGDTTALLRYVDRLRQALAGSPENLAVRLDLAGARLRRGEADSATTLLEDIHRLRPEPPPEAKPHLDSTLAALRAGNLAAARPSFERFQHAMSLTPAYQGALEKVKWVDGPLPGRPILSFNPQSLITSRTIVSTDRRAEVRFVDRTAEAGLSGSATPTSVAMADIDGDGTDNLLLSQRAGTRVYNVQRGFFADVSNRLGTGIPPFASISFSDVDNDGWLDAYSVGEDGHAQLLRNDQRGAFRRGDVTGIRDTSGGRALFVDFDHDGDLDVVIVGGASMRAYRNNLDGSFTDVTSEAGLLGSWSDVAFADFDDDGRIDLIASAIDGRQALLRNTGSRKFEDATAGSGLAAKANGGGIVVVGDYDNDGDFDILVASPAGGEPALWRNSGTGAFARDTRSSPALQRAARTGVVAMRFLDYDNDGWLDLILLGRRGAALLHNDGTGRYEDRSSILPSSVQSGGRAPAHSTLAVSDVDGDGDEDLVIGDSAGVHLLVNEGGNARMGMQVQLLGLRGGSGKNNNFGVGAKVEVRAGEIYQSRVVNERLTHFGLGSHLKADVVRVQWTNGVPDVIYFPGTDQDVLELEQLKGSCAFLYTWDGKGFRFVTDVMWRSALGMPMGLMAGGSAAYAPAGASQEYLRIPGDALRPKNGRYVLQITEELWETAYLDKITLLAVDHPDSVEVFVDERFVPPGPLQLRMYPLVKRQPPRSAVDERGRDVLAALRGKDDVYVGDFMPTRYQGIVEPHDLVLDLGPEAGAPGSTLVLRGWIYPTDASINVALSQGRGGGGSLPTLEVRDARGAWRSAGTFTFPSGKDKAVVVDLAGRFPTDDHHIRIRTNMRIHWDQAFVATSISGNTVRTTTMQPISADLHFRGYSRMYRKGGANGPHWFAYDDASRGAPWRPIEGAFTRFGDVLPLLRQPDDRYVIMAPGDEATVEFDAASASSLPAGWRRTFLLYTDGWIKDSDLNTAYGTSVEPLPFHAIKQYPYAPGESYPSDSAHAEYRRTYNTRVFSRHPARSEGSTPR